MKDGVIADFTVTEQMLKQFIKVNPNRFCCQPAHRDLRALRLTQVERRPSAIRPWLPVRAASS
jgi:actin-like ATPase involved in cell morphogenesis